MKERRHTVLVVEDETDVRELLAELLHDEGYEIVEAANGREALDRLGDAKGHALPSVILLDILMPVLDGWQFRSAQKSDPDLASIPVVVLSAHADISAAAQTMEAAEFLRKPIDFDALLASVRRYCCDDAPGEA